MRISTGYRKWWITDYWVLDVNNRTLHVFREPTQQGYQMQKLSLAAISYRLGFTSKGHFTTFFRKHTGLTPTAYGKLL